MDPATILDALILLWLVGTWFYEGHHKRCQVDVTCSVCGNEEVHKCAADRRNTKRGQMGTKLGTGKVKKATDKALQVELETGETVWIPKSMIHEDSELYDDDKNNEGEVIVKTWWAEKEGLA